MLLVDGVSGKRPFGQLRQVANWHRTTSQDQTTSESVETRCTVAAWTGDHTLVDIAGAASLPFMPGHLGGSDRLDWRIDASEVVQRCPIFIGLVRTAWLAPLRPNAGNEAGAA